MTDLRLSVLPFVLVLVATACQGTTEHPRCNVFRGISCYWTFALNYGVHILVPTPRYEERHLNETYCPKPQEIHILEACSQHYTYCDEPTKMMFEEHERAYVNLRGLLLDHNKCQGLRLLRNCTKKYTMTYCKVHVSIFPITNSAQENFNASTKLSKCLEEALQPCIAKNVAEPTETAQLIAKNTNILLRDPRKSILRAVGPPKTTRGSSLQYSQVPDTSTSASESSSHAATANTVIGNRQPMSSSETPPATKPEETSTPASGVSSVSVPAIGAVVSLVLVSLAQTAQACT